MGFAQVGNLIKDPSALAKFFGFSPILVGDVILDVLVSETPIFEFEVTSHPVEAGLDVTDNRIQKPIGLILECILTDITLDPNQIAGAVAAGVLAGGLPPLTWQDKYSGLKELKDKNSTISVWTPLDNYPSMMITSVRPNQTKDTANAMFFTIELKEVRIVPSEVNVVDASQLPTKVKEQKKPENTEKDKQTKPKKNKGKQGTEATSEKDESALHAGVGSLF